MTEKEKIEKSINNNMLSIWELSRTFSSIDKIEKYGIEYFKDKINFAIISLNNIVILLEELEERKK